MKRHSLNRIACFIVLCLSAACGSSDTKSEDPKPQPIVISDSSDATGRLYVKVYDQSGSSTYSGATVRLFLSYEDLQRNLPLHTKPSDNNGTVDFGYILKGNYYITGAYGSFTVYRDTTVAQILPQRAATRNLYLK